MPFLDENGLEYFYNNCVPIKELIWENPSINSSGIGCFCISSELLDNNLYDGIEVLYGTTGYALQSFDTSGEVITNPTSIVDLSMGLKTTGFIPRGETFQLNSMKFVVSSANSHYRRFGKYEPNIIYFTDAIDKSTTPTTFSISKWQCVPYKIYGIKNELGEG